MPPGLRSNATPHQTLALLAIERFMSAPPIAKSPTTPPIEAATDATTVTFNPKVVEKV